MARRRRRPEDPETERDKGDEVPSQAERPLDSGTIQSLRQADPGARAQAILTLQRAHGNAAVQRVIRALQVTDASRDARVQMIGERAEEPAPSGRLDKAVLYREAIEAELDAAPLAAKSERDLVTDSVNTIGQIFTNYQAALHQFEAAVQSGGGEAVPRELAMEVLREAARDVLEPVMRAAADTVGEVADHVADGLAVSTDRPRAEQPREAGASAPAYALRNLVVAERRRIAAAQMRLLKRQISFGTMAEDQAVASGSGNRARVLAANMDLNAMEEGSHSAAGIFKALMDRYRNAARDAIAVRIVLGADWQVVRAHISAPRGAKLAGQLLQDHSGSFDLNLLHLVRHVIWEPAELAQCEALIDARGTLRRFDRNEKGGRFFDEFQQRLRTGGLPQTRVLTGD
jgi:hypothetical protein